MGSSPATNRKAPIIIDPFALPVARTIAAACLFALMSLPMLFGWISPRLWVFVSIAFVAATILLGMGLGSRLVVNRHGIKVTTTFFGIPYRRDFYPLQSNIGIEKYKNGTPSGVFIVDPHAHRECAVGSQSSADALLAALQIAVNRWRSAERT